MSYIHEALKRAQEQRDGLYSRYGTIIGEPADRRGRRRLWPVLTGTLITVLVAASLWVLYDGASRFVWNRGKAPLSRAGGVPERTVESFLPAEESTPTLYERALARHERGELDKAAEFYAMVPDGDPAYSFAANNLGVICLIRGDREVARKHFSRAVEHKADYADPWYNLACLSAGEGDSDRALDYLATAARLNNMVKSWAEHDTDFDSVRLLPRFREIMERG